MRELYQILRSTWALALADPWPLLEATAAHLDLVLESLVVAVLLGVASGIVAARRRGFERIVLGLANVFQTIPSLALLGFLLILFRGAIGKPPALAALVIYALLPIIKNTVLGLRGIDRGVAEASLGMGMTPWQQLTLVELPLAVPIILGGVRVATVASVGMATIAAAIGAEGLGKYIFRGIQSSDPRLILLGSIPAALLALACDAALGEIERSLDPKRSRRSLIRAILAALAIVALVGLAAWGFAADRASRPDAETIVIGSKDASEPILLGHMLADLVEAKTRLKVRRRFNLSGSMLCYEALRQGGIDAYVEYTGTALTTLLKQPADNDPARSLATVRRLVRRQGIRCLDPVGFENTFAMLMRREQAQRLRIRTISDLRDHQDSIRPGFGYEFMTRPDGYPGLIRAYDLHFADRPREMDRNLLYDALSRKAIDLAAGDATDGRIPALHLTRLIDDRRFFPPYEAVPLVRAETLRRHPELLGALNQLAGRLNAETMQGLNYQVDQLHRDPAQVARAFLRSAGLLPKDSGS